MNQASSWEPIGHLVLNVTRLHFEWKFFVTLKELMSAHLEVLGSIILVTGAWYGIPLFLYMSMYITCQNIFLTNITCSSYNIAELIWQFRIGLKRIILLNEMELLKVYLVLLFVVQNIERRKSYKVSLHIRSSDAISLSVSLRSSDGLQKLACHTIT
jgi:hypothetical protein